MNINIRQTTKAAYKFSHDETFSHTLFEKSAFLRRSHHFPNQVSQFLLIKHLLLRRPGPKCVSYHLPERRFRAASVNPMALGLLARI